MLSENMLRALNPHGLSSAKKLRTKHTGADMRTLNALVRRGLINKVKGSLRQGRTYELTAQGAHLRRYLSTIPKSYLTYLVRYKTLEV